MKLSKDDMILYAGAAGLAFIAWKIATRGIGGTASDLVGGVITGVFDAASGIVSGGYNALPEAIKPSSTQNVVYRAASVPVRMLPGTSKDETLGTWLYNVTHPNEQF